MISKEAIVRQKRIYGKSRFEGHIATDDCLDAMDEYAKEVAIGFGYWITGERYIPAIYDDKDNGVVYYNKKGEGDLITPEELFELYLQSLK